MCSLVGQRDELPGDVDEVFAGDVGRGEDLAVVVFETASPPGGQVRGPGTVAVEGVHGAEHLIDVVGRPAALGRRPG